MIEYTLRQDLTRTFQKIQRPLRDRESPPSPKLYPPDSISPFINGIKAGMTRRKGRTTKSFFIRWKRGRCATRVMVKSPPAKTAKSRNA